MPFLSLYAQDEDHFSIIRDFGGQKWPFAHLEVWVESILSSPSILG